MKVYKAALLIILALFVFSCGKESDTVTSSKSSGGTSSDSDSDGLGGGSSTVVTSNMRFTQNATLETHTETGCPSCPGADAYAEQMVTKYGERLIPISYHYDFYWVQSGIIINPVKFYPDWERNYNNGTALANAFNIRGYPTQYLNRKQALGDDKIAAVLNTVSGATSSTVGLAIKANIDGSNLSITVKSRFAQAISGLKLVVFVLEDGIIGDHSGPNGLIKNYVNNHVMRDNASELLGDVIPSQSGPSEYSKTYKMPIMLEADNSPNRYWNKDKLSVVAMITKSDDTLLNVRKAKIGENQDFEIAVK